MTELSRPQLRIVRGDPTPEELAVVTAIVTAVASAPPGENGAPPQRGRWNDPAGGVRRPLLPGPGAWRATSR